MSLVGFGVLADLAFLILIIAYTYNTMNELAKVECLAVVSYINSIMYYENSFALVLLK